MAYGGSQARDPNRSYSCQPTSQPQQQGIWAMSATYTTAHGHARSWVRPGIGPASSWILVGFITCWATMRAPFPWEFWFTESYFFVIHELIYGPVSRCGGEWRRRVWSLDQWWRLMAHESYIRWILCVWNSEVQQRECARKTVYVDAWVTLLFSRNWHNMVNQLYVNEKLFKKLKQSNLVHVSLGTVPADRCQE